MKKYILYILILTAVIFAQSQVPKLDQYANDYTGTLTKSEIQYLNRDLKNFEDTTSTQVVFMMISSLNNYPMEMYTYDVASKNQIGTKKNDNGVLFFVAKKDRKMRIEVGYGLEGTLPDALASSILRNEVAPYFRQNEYFKGIKAGLNAIKLATVGEYKQKRKYKDDDNRKGFPIIYIILFIIISIISRFRRGGAGIAPWILLGGLGGGGRSSGSGGSFGGGGFGGFSGGGGSFGGGGASGGW